jgi:hypothetical protein
MERFADAGPLIAAEAAPSSNLLEIDAGAFARAFDRSPFVIRHNLCGHPLLKLDRLIEIASVLPEKNVEYNAGNVPISCDPNKTPRNGLSCEETIRRIECCNSWMALKNVEQDPEYHDLLMRCLDEVRPYCECIAPGMTRAEAFIFVSSPNSITPYHIDPEHNFLLQIQGNKFMTVFERSLVSIEELEHFHSGAHRNMTFNESNLSKGTTYELLPGDGLHVPVTAPHYVRNGSNVSISLSITFRTPDLESKGMVHQVNRYLRGKGLRPAPVGQYPVLDALKVLSCRAVRKAHSLLRKGT